MIGGGLSGLTAASALLADGIEVVLVEAQGRLGGRILTSATETDERGCYDLGPTWCWPAHQPRMAALLRQLGLATFAQPRAGAMLYELTPTQRQRVAGDGADDGSQRVVGGMQAVIEALVATLPPGVIQRNQPVTALRATGDGVEVSCAAHGDSPTTITADAVLCTLSPRLAAATLSFSPPLPPDTARQWAAVSTWMAAHAKFVAVYRQPFWRADGLSGEARSQVGPMVEIHDATAPSGPAALFGFLGVSAAARQGAGDDAITAAAITQLARLFGEQAQQPVATFFKDWSADRWAATPDDAIPPHAHPIYGALAQLPAPWADRFWLAGTEVAPTHGGYLEGALEAAERAVANARGLRHR